MFVELKISVRGPFALGRGSESGQVGTKAATAVTDSRLPKSQASTLLLGIINEAYLDT